jgi:methylglyoxal synthase
MRVCNVHNVPLATNLATADLIITGLTRGDWESPANAHVVAQLP